MGDCMVRHFAIQFDRKNAIYVPGEVISGKILAEFTQPKQMTGLRVEILGESAVQWFLKNYEPDPDLEHQEAYPTSTEVMTGHEKYFSSKFHLLGRDSGPPFVLPAGLMSHPFKFQLPIKLPSSFEHEYGYVRYTIKATLDSPWESPREVKTTFAVDSTYDLNRKSEAFLAIREDMIKNFLCSCICPTGKIYSRFYIPSAGFVPGQMIPVTVHCQNESTVDVTKIKVSLLRNLKFHAKSPAWKTKSEETTVTHTQRVAPFTNDSEERVTIQLRVPPLPPTGLEHCGLIDVDYELQIVMCFSGMHFSIKRRFPILIGTVPLHNFTNTYKPNAGPLPSGAKPHPDHWDPKNLSPPSYDTSLYAGSQTIGDQNESMYIYGAANPFVSRYPVYDCASSLQSPMLP